MKNASIPWNPNLKTEADALCADILEQDQNAFSTALDAEAFLRFQAFQKGVKAYHGHPYERQPSRALTVWRKGPTRLLDYGGPDDGPVLLAVPSLINKAYILDLKEKRSLMRALRDQGVRCFLLDWGEVGEDEKTMSLEDYILTRLEPCLDRVAELSDQKKVSLLGYCMGGVLTTALASIRPEKVASMCLLATPWDFHAGHGAHRQVIKASEQALTQVTTQLGILPVDTLQALFAAIDPYQVINKFIKFSSLNPKTKRAEDFVALEDWLNDAVPLGGQVARECLLGWYVDNKPFKGEWQLDGQTVKPGNITCPTLIYIPTNDRIVVPESAQALGTLVPHAKVKSITSGHISMVCGKKSTTQLYAPLAKWLLLQKN